MTNALRRRLRAAVLALTLAASAGVAAFGQSVPLISQTFSMNRVGQGPIIVLSGQSTCSIQVDNAGSGLTLVPEATSDKSPSPASQWTTASTVGGGSISTYGNYVGNIAGTGTTGFSFAITALSSGTVSGSIACSGALGLSNSSGPAGSVIVTNTPGVNVQNTPGVTAFSPPQGSVTFAMTATPQPTGTPVASMAIAGASVTQATCTFNGVTASTGTVNVATSVNTPNLLTDYAIISGSPVGAAGYITPISEDGTYVFEIDGANFLNFSPLNTGSGNVTTKCNFRTGANPLLFASDGTQSVNIEHIGGPLPVTTPAPCTTPSVSIYCGVYITGGSQYLPYNGGTPQPQQTGSYVGIGGQAGSTFVPGAFGANGTFLIQNCTASLTTCAAVQQNANSLGAQNALDVNSFGFVFNGSTQQQALAAHAIDSAQPASPGGIVAELPCDGAGGFCANVTSGHALKVDGSAVTQPVSIATTVPVSIATTVPVSGTVTASLPYSSAANQTAVSNSGILGEIFDGTNVQPWLGSTSGVGKIQICGANGVSTTCLAGIGIKSSANSLSVTPASDATFPVSCLSAATCPVLATQAQPGTATITSVASSASSVQLLASNSSRKGYIACNISNQPAYVAEGATATTSSGGFSFILMGTGAVPYACHEEHGIGVYTGAFNAIWASANGAMTITEEQ